MIVEALHHKTQAQYPAPDCHRHLLAPQARPPLTRHDAPMADDAGEESLWPPQLPGFLQGVAQIDSAILPSCALHWPAQNRSYEWPEQQKTAGLADWDATGTATKARRAPIHTWRPAGSFQDCWSGSPTGGFDVVVENLHADLRLNGPTMCGCATANWAY
jgi:hypothetical protein